VSQKCENTSKKTYKTAYACGVDWQHDLGEARIDLYPTVESLKRNRTCWKQCGIVKLEISLGEWVEQQDLYKHD